MSTVLDFYPGDEVIVGAALVAVATSITAVISLLIARRVVRQPPFRHTVLAAALFCILATPLIAVLIRSSGKSTIAWSLLPAPQHQRWQQANASDDAAIGERLASVGEPELIVSHHEPATADRLTTLETRRREMPVKSIAVASSKTAADTAHTDQAIRFGVTLAMIIWLFGCGILLIRFAYGSIHIFSICRSGRPFFEIPPEVAKEVLRCLGADRLPLVLVSDRVQAPSATGALRGTVILPATLVTRITPDELCDVLIHECAHVGRRDPLMRNLQIVAELLFWPIPFVHWLNRQLSCAREEICDNYVIAHRDALQYADTLLRIATHVGKTQHSFALVGMLPWRGNLETRIARLIDKGANKSTRTTRSRAFLCLAAFLSVSVAVSGAKVRAAPTEYSAPQPQADAAEIDDEMPSKSAAPIEIEVWWGVGGLLNDAFEQQVRRFNELQDEIVVEVRLFDGYGQLYRELNKAFKDDDLPDAAIIEIHQVASFAAAGQIQELDTFIKEDRAFKPDDLLPGILTNLRYRELLYALPINRSTPILYYNKDRFSAAGLDPTKPPATWQELREMSRVLTSDEQKQYGFAAVSSPWVFESLVWGNGGELFVDGRPSFAKAGADPLRLWADMVHRDHSAQFLASGDRREEFFSGRAAMAVDSTALLREYASESKFALGTAPLPYSRGGQNAVPTGGGAAVIPATNEPERKTASWIFLSWCTSTLQTAQWSRDTGYIPVRTSARNRLQAQGFYNEHPEFDVAIEQMKYAREAPPEWLGPWKIIAEKMTAVVCDDAPALETLEGAEKSITKALNAKVTPKP